MCIEICAGDYSDLAKQAESPLNEFVITIRSKKSDVDVVVAEISYQALFCVWCLITGGQ